MIYSFAGLHSGRLLSYQSIEEFGIMGDYSLTKESSASDESKCWSAWIIELLYSLELKKLRRIIERKQIELLEMRKKSLSRAQLLWWRFVCMIANLYSAPILFLFLWSTMSLRKLGVFGFIQLWGLCGHSQLICWLQLPKITEALYLRITEALYLRF